MPYSIHVFPGDDLAWIRYFGVVTDTDYQGVVRDYPQHPDFRLGQRMIVDLSDMTALKFRHLLVIALQARIADYAMASPNEILQVIIAPNPVGLRAAAAVMRSWRGIKTPVVRRVVRDHDEAGQIMGLDAARLAEMRRSFDGVDDGRRPKAS